MLAACNGRQAVEDDAPARPSPARAAPPPLFEEQGFLEGLHKSLADVEHFAKQQIAQMAEALAEARAENDRLRNELSQKRLGGPGLQEEKEAPRPPVLADRGSVGVLDSEPGPGAQSEKSTARLPPHSAGAGVSSSKEYTSTGTSGSGRVNASRSLRTSMASLFSHGAHGQALEIIKKLSRVQTSATGATYKKNGWVQRIVQSQWFEYGSLLVVMVNALWIAIDLDANGQPLLESPMVFQIMEHLFVTIFSIEILLRFLAFENKCMVFFDKWFIFDFTLVTMMIIESWVLTAIVVLTKAEGLSGLGVLSALRILRLLRLARLSRLFRVVPELQTMIAGMVAGIRSVMITATILFAMTYTFAICLRQLGAGTEWGNDYFSSVPRSIYTLLIESMLPDNGELLGVIGSDVWYCGVIYWVFLMLSAITVMNMLIGILCEVVGQVSSDQKEAHRIELMGERLEEILKTVDKDYDGLVSKSEFESILENEEAMKVLMDVDVNVEALVDDSEFLFYKKGTLPFEDFKEEVLSFRNTPQASMKSLLGIRKQLRTGNQEIMRRLDKMEKADMHGKLPSKSSSAHVSMNEMSELSTARDRHGSPHSQARPWHGEDDEGESHRRHL